MKSLRMTRSQGLAAGIGFIGAGAILKLREQREIEGFTTRRGHLDDRCRRCRRRVGRIRVGKANYSTAARLEIVGTWKTRMG